MPAHLTAAEARALGITATPTRTRTTRKTAHGPYRTLCHTCGDVFDTQAAESRHVAPGHTRFDVQIGETTVVKVKAPDTPKTVTVTQYTYTFRWDNGGDKDFAEILTEMGGQGWRVHTVIGDPEHFGVLLEKSFLTETEWW